MNTSTYRRPLVMIVVLWMLSLSAAHAQITQTAVILSPENTREIFVEASTVSGYPPPTTLPEIHILPKRQFIAEVCPGALACPVAVSSPGKPILVRGDMDPEDNTDRSFFIHEAIHMLQYVSKQITDVDALSCTEMLTLEKEAYVAQQRYLDRNGQLLRVTSVITRMQCTDSITLSF